MDARLTPTYEQESTAGGTGALTWSARCALPRALLPGCLLWALARSLQMGAAHRLC